MSAVIAAVVAALAMRRLNCQPKAIFWLAIVFLFSFLCDLASFIIVFLDEQPRINPNIVSQFGYHTIAVIFESAMFYWLIKWRGLKPVIVVICIGYVLFAIVNFLFLQKTSFTSFTSACHSLIVLFYSVLFYYKLLKDLPAQQVQSLPEFWIVSGFFFSFAGKLVVYTVTHFLLIYLKDNMIMIWTFHNLLSIFGNGLSGYGVWLHYRHNHSVLSS